MRAFAVLRSGEEPLQSMWKNELLDLKDVHRKALTVLDKLSQRGWRVLETEIAERGLRRSRGCSTASRSHAAQGEA